MTAGLMILSPSGRMIAYLPIAKWTENNADMIPNPPALFAVLEL